MGEKDLSQMTEIEPHMSNFNHSIDDDCEEQLRANENKVYCHHAAWNFCGYVWFENGKFHEQVMRYKNIIDELSADSLEELKEEVNSTYGYA